MNDTALKNQLFNLGLILGVERYVGQRRADAANEFAEKMFLIFEELEDRLVSRLEQK